MASLAFAGIASWLGRARRSVSGILYAAYVWAVFVCMAPLAWGAVAVLPVGRAAWSVSRLASRAFLRLTGLVPEVSGSEHMPAHGACVLVANHASYLDGLLLVAVLPRPVAFVAKQELTRSAWSRIPLARLEAEFVERFDVEQSVADAQRLADGSLDGRCLFYFAEGTFSREPGLRPFKMGAFVNAARSNLTVVPVTLRGTRSVLRDKSWFPRRASIRVTFSAAIAPEGHDWQAAVKLRDAAREAIRELCGEPDLTQ
jgi:1-acyl-sn-glycerol-3-phosphate acyltransferase